MKILAAISWVSDPSGKTFGFVLHDIGEIPHVPLVPAGAIDRKLLEGLRDRINEVLEW